MPFQYGFARIGRDGDTPISQWSNNFKIRRESGRSLRLEEFGLIIRSQILFSVFICNDVRSAREDTA